MRIKFSQTKKEVTINETTYKITDERLPEILGGLMEKTNESLAKLDLTLKKTTRSISNIEEGTVLPENVPSERALSILKSVFDKTEVAIQSTTHTKNAIEYCMNAYEYHNNIVILLFLDDNIKKYKNINDPEIITDYMNGYRFKKIEQYLAWKDIDNEYQRILKLLEEIEL